MAYQQYTLADLRQRLADRYESVPFWDTTEADDAINEWLRTWNLLTGRWTKRVVIAATPATYEYALPATLSYRTRVLYENQPMSPASREDFNNGRPNWRRESTADGGTVPTRPMLWAPVSLMLIYVWPMDAGHGSFTLDGVAATPELLTAGQYVDLSEADLSVGLGFALHVLTLKKGSVWFQASLPYFKSFLAAAAEENQLITTSVMYRRAMGLDHRDLKPLRAPIATPSAGLGQGAS